MTDYRYLSLDDLTLVISTWTGEPVALPGDVKGIGADVLTALRSTSSWTTYSPALVELGALIAALPPAVRAGSSWTALLGTTDQRHDSLARVIHLVCQAIAEDPDASAETQQAAARVRTALVPELAIVQAPFASEAAAAERNALTLADVAEDLALIPWTDKRTLGDVAKAFVKAGQDLGELLRQRATSDAADRVNGRSGILTLRSQAFDYIGGLRQSVRIEVSHNKALRRDLEATAFALFDALAAMRTPKGTPKGTPE